MINIQNKKRSGPRTEHWGTSEFKVKAVEEGEQQREKYVERNLLDKLQERKSLKWKGIVNFIKCSGDFDNNNDDGDDNNSYIY